jgi:hypothetical protein
MNFIRQTHHESFSKIARCRSQKTFYEAVKIGIRKDVRHFECGTISVLKKTG